MQSSLSTTEARALLGISTAALAIIVNAVRLDGGPLVVSIAFLGLAFSATFALIRWLGPVFIRAGWKGIDMSKTNKAEKYVDIRDS